MVLFPGRVVYQRCIYPAGIYLLKCSNRNTGTRCELCSSVSIVNFEHVISGWVGPCQPSFLNLSTIILHEQELYP